MKQIQVENNLPLDSFRMRQLSTYVREQADMARQKGTMRPIVDELVFQLLLSAGLRPKEICQLDIRDTPCFHERSIISVSSDEVHRSREVVIPKDIDEMICRFVTLFRKHSNPEDPLLVSERGNRFGYASLYSKIRRIGTRVGFSGINPNILRKTYMTGLFERERDLRYVQQQAGHACPKTTALYVKPAKVFCSACSREITDNDGKLIDSGQILCLKCLKEFR